MSPEGLPQAEGGVTEKTLGQLAGAAMERANMTERLWMFEYWPNRTWWDKAQDWWFGAYRERKNE